MDQPKNLADMLRHADVAHVLHPYTNLAIHEQQGPLIIDRGEGVYVWDDQGRRYLEGLAGLWCVSLGFSEQRLFDAAADQFARLPYAHTFAHRSTAPVVELAERLIGMAPPTIDKAFFLNSGSEAVDTAVKFTWYYHNGIGRPQKKKIISRRRGYHGVTVAGASLTAIPLMQDGFDLPLPQMRATDTPCFYRYAEPDETEAQFSERLARNLENLILDEDPDTVGAFIAEPIMGAGGVMVPPIDYFQRIQEVLRKYDILMIADEVICGFGRTGNWWGCDTYDIQPDMVTCAKQLSSGYLPISALLVSDKVYGVLRDQSKTHGALGMGYTYGGHPVACAVALETLKIYEERRIVDHVREVSPRFLQRLAALAQYLIIGDARGAGLLGGLEIVKNQASKAQYPPDMKVAARIAHHALEHGLIVRALPGDCVGICPPLIIDEKQIDELFDRLEMAIEITEKELANAP